MGKHEVLVYKPGAGGGSVLLQSRVNMGKIMYPKYPKKTRKNVFD